MCTDILCPFMDPKSFGKIHMVSYHMVGKLVVAPPLPIFSRKIMQKSHVDGSKPMKLPIWESTSIPQPFPSHSPAILGYPGGFWLSIPQGPLSGWPERSASSAISTMARKHACWRWRVVKRGNPHEAKEPILATKMLIFSRTCGEISANNGDFFLWQGW